MHQKPYNEEKHSFFAPGSLMKEKEQSTVDDCYKILDIYERRKYGSSI
jgi:hypothetical protein